MSSSRYHLLFVEDEESIGEGLCFNFEHEGYDVTWIQHGGEALNFIKNNLETIHLLVLDLMLPGMDGFRILEETRDRAARLPIIVLSAKNLEVDRVRALMLGADDYLTKPFSLPELLLRIKGLLKRSSWLNEQLAIQSKANVIPFADGEFHTDRLIFERRPLVKEKLSPTEASLLSIFAARPDEILSRNQLLKEVWDYQPGTETRTVDVYVSRLRKIIERNDKQPNYLLSVRGAGYVYATQPETRRSYGQKSRAGKNG